MSARQVGGVVIGSHGGDAKGLHAKAWSLAGAAASVSNTAESDMSVTENVI